MPGHLGTIALIRATAIGGAWILGFVAFLVFGR